MEVEERGTSIVPVLSCVLNQLCLRNDQHPDQKGVSKFHALRPPAISIRDYLNRIAKYASCSGECFVLALVYIDRIIQSNPNFVVNSLNIHRLLITSVMLAAKFFDDQYFNNAYYAKVGGVPCNEINSLEVEFLFMTNFSLFVGTDTYRQYYTELCNHAQNGSCDCTSQRGKIPPLKFPVPDAQGTATSSLSGEEVPNLANANAGGGWGGFDGFDGRREVKEAGGVDGHEGVDGRFYPSGVRNSENITMTSVDSPFVSNDRSSGSGGNSSRDSTASEGPAAMAF